MKKQKNIIHFITSILNPESITTINLPGKSVPPSKCMFLFNIYFLFIFFQRWIIFGGILFVVVIIPAWKNWSFKQINKFVVLHMWIL